MITGISIENFKGIRDRVEIELRPLTLLFGANSAGKSTLVDGLELFELLLLDRHHRRGKSLTRRFDERFGSIREATHGQTSSHITIGVTISRNEEWQDYFEDLTSYESGFDADDPTFAGCSIPEMGTCSLGGDVAQSLTLELTFTDATRFSNDGLKMLAEITQVAIHVNDQFLLSIALESTSNQLVSTAWTVDTEHPVFGDWLQRVGERTFHVHMKHVIPPENEPAILAGFCDDLDDGSLAVGLNLIIPAVLKDFELELSRVCRIGPLRSVPARNYVPRPNPSREDWLHGLAAWDEVGFLSEEPLMEINHWLGPEQLDCGIEVVKRILISLEEALAMDRLKTQDPTALGQKFLSYHTSGMREVKLRPVASKYTGPFESDALLSPSQVGSGIAQILPILVACLTNTGDLLSIAQPELHLHPRLQVKLGDLFTQCLFRNSDQCRPNRLVVETHSEHLILRLLRRIRETSKGLVSDARRLMSEDLVIYHVSLESGATRIRRIDVDKHGEFVQPWPDDFFEIDFYERFGP